MILFLQDGVQEDVKAFFHGAACGLALLMASYNAGAWLQRGGTRLLVQAILYTLAAECEWTQTKRHLRGGLGAHQHRAW